MGNSEEVPREAFSAEKFVENLLTEGCKYPYEDTYERTGTKEDLPDFYNEIMFKKGQKFFHKYMTGVFLSCLLALVQGFSHPVAKILVMTNKSSTPLTSYKRYSATIMHMCTWYKSDLKHGSELWSSIRNIRRMHYTASKQAQSHLNYQITQYNLVAAVMGFMDFALVRSELVGIHNASNEELQSFIHFWRVMGYLFGIEDRFNICRESVEETKEAIILLLQKDLIPKTNVEEDCSVTLSKAFIEGMKGVTPLISYDHTIDYLYMLLGSFHNSNHYKQLVSSSRTNRWNYIRCLVWTMRFNIGRIVMNHLLGITLELAKYFPLFAYFKFGKKNAHVAIS